MRIHTAAGLFVLALIIALPCVVRAECPATLTDARIDGATSDGKYTRYHVDLRSSLGAARPASITLKDDTGLSIGTAELQPEGFSITTPERLSLPGYFSFWARSRATKVELGAADAISSDTCSSQPIQGRVRSYQIPRVEIYADDFPRALPRNGDFMGLESLTDASIVNAARPDYPVLAKMQGLSGTAVVEVWVGPKGRAEKVKIYQSSGLRSFDEAGMDAARRTSYTPPFANGQATTRSYLIEYRFRLEGQQLSEGCGIGISGARATHVFDKPAWQLVDLSFYGELKHVSGVEFVVNVPASGQSAVVGWQDIDSGLTENDFNAELGVLVDGSDADLVSIGGVRAGSDTTTACDLDVISILDPNGAAIAKEPIRSGQLPDVSLVYPAQFMTEVPARYPRDEMADHQSGYAKLLFHLDASGKPVNVMVIDASTDQAFVKAASAALRQSTFVPPPAQGSQGYFRAYYDFHGNAQQLASESKETEVPRSF